MAELNYNNYQYPTTPFVFDIIYEEAIYVTRDGDNDKVYGLGGPGGIGSDGKPYFLSETDEVFINHYILIKNYKSTASGTEVIHKGAVFQKRIDSKTWSGQPYYKWIVDLDFEHLHKAAIDTFKGEAQNIIDTFNSSAQSAIDTFEDKAQNAIDTFNEDTAVAVQEVESLLEEIKDKGLIWRDLDKEATNS